MKIEPACSVCCRPIHKFYYIDFVGDSIVKKYTCPQCKNEGVYIIHNYKQWRKRVVSIITLLLTLYSCGYEVKTNDSRIDEVFLKFISYAEQYRTQVDLSGLSIVIGNLKEIVPGSDPRAAAVCVRYGVPIVKYETSKKIVVDYDFWSMRKFDTLYLEMVLFHELGHCVMDINYHTNDNEMMGDTTMPLVFYKANRERLIYNLFKHRR